MNIFNPCMIFTMNIFRIIGRRKHFNISGGGQQIQPDHVEHLCQVGSGEQASSSFYQYARSLIYCCASIFVALLRKILLEVALTACAYQTA
jgi:hypothetical protein